MNRELQLDVFFELICPWCLIGKRHLERALVELGRAEPVLDVRIAWHPVQLLPQIPATGLPFREFYARRLGGAGAVATRQAEVQAAAAQAGLRIAFERIGVMPNTARAHRWLRYTAATGDARRQEALLDALFCAYFLEGEDIGDAEVLARLATQVGLDPAREAAWQATPAPPAPLVPDGVPCFVFERHTMLAGAQPPPVLLAALREALGARPAGARGARA